MKKYMYKLVKLKMKNLGKANEWNITIRENKSQGKPERLTENW